MNDLHTIVLTFDQIAYKRKRQSIHKGVKESLRPFVQPQLAYRIFFHSSQSNPYLQAVDYFNWAIYVKWIRGETRPYKVVERAISSEVEVLFG